MNNWILKFRRIDEENFEKVRSGIKRIETRAATIKYRPIETGDTLTFTCGEKRFSKKIIKKFHWPDIDTMVKEIPFKKVMPSVNSVDEMKNVYASYPGYEQKIKEYGLFGFELE